MMLLAGDVGGTKTFMGLFERAASRPAALTTRTYRTLDFQDLGALSRQFLSDCAARVAAESVAL